MVCVWAQVAERICIEMSGACCGCLMMAIIVEHEVSEGKYNFDGRCMFVPAAFNVKNLLKILSLSRKNGFASFFCHLS